MTDSNADSDTDAEGDPVSGADATGPDDEAVREAREEVVEALARAADVYGIKPSYGRLYGLLFFAEEPLSLDDLADRSDYAKSTVSTAMTALERYHFVHRRSIPGEGKKAYFEAETDLWHVCQQFLTQEVRSEVRIMTRALDDAAETLRAADSERARRDLEKVERLRSLYEKADTAVTVLTSSSLDRITSVLRRLRSGE
ncbi:GbsR/MarR family transcriptional regulator [Halorussus sp. AFM4]|uniref:GbsR/MarR family transcriptional regulator n=1 Tax=Halorussus sp. AFM4 TaxID=3421651 RepID=UPI003EBB8C18